MPHFKFTRPGRYADGIRNQIGVSQADVERGRIFPVGKDFLGCDHWGSFVEPEVEVEVDESEETPSDPGDQIEDKRRRRGRRKPAEDDEDDESEDDEDDEE